MNRVSIAEWNELKPKEPAYALVGNVDLVIMRWENEDQVSVLFGRCLHRGALLADGHIRGKDLICGLHEWDYNYKTGISSYNPEEQLHRFSAWIENGKIWVDEAQISAWEVLNPQAYDRDAYQGLYQDIHGGPEEPHAQYIQYLAEKGLSEIGHHGRVSAMGVPLSELPKWEDIQLLTAQLYKVPLLDDHPVGTQVVIGPNAKKPLILERPLFVSDMSFGALSEEAKVTLAKGAELAGTGICSGEGGMLPDEQAANSRYFYELASARFGYSMEQVQKCQAFHFKCGQGAKTGTGGHLPGNKVQGKIAEVRGLPEGESAISPSRFPDWENLADYTRFAEEVREATGGIPIGVKLSAQHIERDIQAALDIGV
ncbi:MAG: Rieske 2Fe-2S domain-containing protein, partial [Candidatus Marinimicrobia bacterium]|nr:Rieske 2Fe-2S domain-containing protein [Candidatus Neomarinimicrobiota bacterium]